VVKSVSEKPVRLVDRNEKARVSSKVIYLAVPLAVISIVCMFLMKFMHYKYKSKPYATGMTSFLFGKAICKGKDMIEPSLLVWGALVALVLIVLVVLFITPRKRVLGGELVCIFSAIAAVMLIIFTVKVGKSFDVPKNVEAGLGPKIGSYIAILIFALGIFELRENRVLMTLDFMLLPGLTYLIINNYIPMFGIIVAFQKVDFSKGVFGGDFVGFENFRYLFQTKDAWIITRNTLLYNFVWIILGMIVGFAVGMCLFEVFSRTLQKVYQTTILLPQLISMIIVAYMVYGFLSNDTGMLNGWLGEERHINFYAEPKYWPFILTVVHIWKGLGYNAIIYLSSICGIDANLYEAAKIDGASKWQQIIHVTLPQMKSTMVTLFILNCGRIFYSDFGLFYQVPMRAGALLNVTNTIDVYVYKALMVRSNIATASAASAFQAVVGFVLVMTVNAIVRKLDRSNAMF